MSPTMGFKQLESKGYIDSSVYTWHLAWHISKCLINRGEIDLIHFNMLGFYVAAIWKQKKFLKKDCSNFYTQAHWSRKT